MKRAPRNPQRNNDPYQRRNGSGASYSGTDRPDSLDADILHSRAQRTGGQPRHAASLQADVIGRDSDSVYTERQRNQKQRTSSGNPQREQTTYREDKELYRASRQPHEYGNRNLRGNSQNGKEGGSHRSREEVPTAREVRRNHAQDTRRPVEKHRTAEPDFRGKNRKKLQKKKRSKGRTVLTIAAVVAAVVLVFFGLWKLSSGFRSMIVKAALNSGIGSAIATGVLGKAYNANVLDSSFDKTKVRVNDGVTAQDGYTTFALFGVDSRGEGLGKGTNSDSMIIVSIQNSTGEVKMASIYRDTYLLSRTEDGTEVISKANSAYSRGGPEGALSMINECFDMDVEDYVTVNFAGLTNIIDAMGGLTVTITDDEVKDINDHMYEQIYYYGGDYQEVTQSGTITLTGAQATAYCRCRTANFIDPETGETYTDDFGRTARQRYVITLLLAKIKNQGAAKLVSVAKQICEENVGDNKFMQTSMSLKSFMKLVAKCLDMNIVGTNAFPTTDYSYGKVLDSGESIVANRLEDNARELHKFLYDLDGYEVSDDLKTIQKRIEYEVSIQ